MPDSEYYQIRDMISLLQSLCHLKTEHATRQIWMPQAGFELVTTVLLTPKTTLTLKGTWC